MDYQIRTYAIFLFICTFCNIIFAGLVPPQKIVSSEDYQDVSVKLSGLTAILDNGLINVTFDNEATVSSLYYNGENLVKNVAPHQTFYLDWYNGSFGTFLPSSLHVFNESPQCAHLMYFQDVSGFLKYEYHIIMEKGLRGLYTYVKATNNKRQPLTLEETRIIYRFDPKMRHVTNSVQEGILPEGNELTNERLVQDTTWRLSDGSIYTKYDYAGYIRNTPYMGVFENKGYGAWLISANRDYHSGGPLKQDILVHQEALIANYMTGRHFGTPKMTTPVGWSKLYGPWLLYFNNGTADEMKKDVIRQTKVEQNLWPYKWMSEPDYPLKRAKLRGKVTSPVRSMVVLSSSLTEKFDLQTLGFSYSTETDKNGEFQLENIRPGTYQLVAYPIEGFGIGYLSAKLVNIQDTHEGANNTAFLNLPVPTEVKWSIGETNRRSDSYCYSNEERNYIWHTLPPADLEFQIGKSDIHKDWYYAQTKPGTWTIRYKDIPNGKNRILRIGIAAASNVSPDESNPLEFPVIAVSVNGQLMNEFKYVDDKTVYRSAPQSGSFYPETLIIPASLVKEEDNLVSFILRQGSVMYDSINLSDAKDSSII